MQHIVKPLDDLTGERPGWRFAIDPQQRHVDVDVTDPNGAVFSVTIEVSDNKLVVHCFDPAHDEPLRVRISASGLIETDEARFGDQVVHHSEYQGGPPPP